MIEYTIQFLRLNRIKNAYLFSRYPKRLEDYFAKKKTKGIPNIQVLNSEDCESTGDILREVHTLQLIRGDFIVIKTGLVANFLLDDIIKNHLKRKEENKMNLITKIYKRVPPNHPLKTDDDNFIVLSDPTTKQIFNMAKSDEGILNGNSELKKIK